MNKSVLLSVMVLLLLMVYCIDPGQKKLIYIAEQQLKDASENYLKAWSDKDSTLILELSTPDFERIINGKIVSNSPAGLVKSLGFWHTAIPDFKLSIREITAKGNRTYISWTCTGTHTGMLDNVPPTGKKSTTEGFSVLTFNDEGEIEHESAYYDQLGVMQEWGFTLAAPVME